MDKLTEGLWRWTARHPEWHPGEFGAEVASYAAQAGDTTLLIDPLLPPDPSSVLAVIDENLGKRLAVLITVPYHVRSAEELWQRYRKDAETTIHGHRACAKRLDEPRPHSSEIEPGVPLPGGVTAHAIGKPASPRDAATPPEPSRSGLRRRGRRDRRSSCGVVEREGRRQGRAFLPRALQPDARTAARARLRHGAGHPRAAADERREARAAQGARLEALVPPRLRYFAP